MPKNQCDGCRAGMELNWQNNIHYDHNGRPFMVCSRDDYEDSPKPDEKHTLDELEELRVVIEFRGGIPHVTLPKGVVIETRDYECDGFPPEELSQDDDGKSYLGLLYFPED